MLGSHWSLPSSDPFISRMIFFRLQEKDQIPWSESQPPVTWPHLVAPYHSSNAIIWPTLSSSAHHIPSCSSPHTACCFCLKCPSYFMSESPSLILQGQTPMSWPALPIFSRIQTGIHAPSMLPWHLALHPLEYLEVCNPPSPCLSSP